ncbi:MAG TPA: hypothetical protein ENH15_05400 [Actinobacteria bacterium]|nr:hypothetical protein [Actinomycetota bacterium]
MNRRKALNGLRIIYLAVAAALISWTIFARWGELSRLLDGTRLAWLAASLVMSFGMLGLSGALWRHLLIAQGEPVALSTAVHSTARAVLARYVPGSIWFALGRATLLSRLGVGAGPLTVTAATEIVLSVATTVAGGAILLGLVGAFPGGALWMVGAAIVLAAAASPAVAGRAIAFVAAKRGAQMAKISWRSYLGAVGISVAFWTWSALTFTTYLRAFPLADGIGIATLIGGFLFAWGVGFLAIFAPQGIGVFEVTLAAILFDGGLSETAVLIGGYRLITLVRDAIATGLAEATAPRFTPPDPFPTDNH